jgi:DNA-binding PadR family transcriptional regulator
MPSKPLPKELASLIQHVELQDAGWRSAALEQIVIAILLSVDFPLHHNDIRASLYQLGTQASRDEIDQATRRLVEERLSVVRVGRKFKLTEAYREELAQRTAEDEELEQRVKDKFLSMLQKHGVPLVAADFWTSFTNRLLFPLIDELGARTYEFLSGKSTNLSGSINYRDFLTTIPESLRTQFADAIDKFLDPSDSDIRSYMLRHLHARLLIDAINLNEKTLAAIQTHINKIQMNVLVDTNFLFSALDLHDNPANEPVQALAAIARELTAKVDIRFYVMPITLDEARRTLSSYEQQLSGIDVTAHISRAAQTTTSDLSGIASRFIRAANDSKLSLTAREYFSPYIYNLLAIARAKGFEIYGSSPKSVIIRGGGLRSNARWR